VIPVEYQQCEGGSDKCNQYEEPAGQLEDGGDGALDIFNGHTILANGTVTNLRWSSWSSQRSSTVISIDEDVHVFTYTAAR
jgi:hypothetical protein